MASPIDASWKKGAVITRRTALLAAMAAMLLACTSVVEGQSFVFTERTREKIIKGRSTAADVRLLVGEPLSIEKSKSQEVWNYHVREKRQADYVTRDLTVWFNPDGTVADVKDAYKSKLIFPRH